MKNKLFITNVYDDEGENIELYLVERVAGKYPNEYYETLKHCNTEEEAEAYIEKKGG